MRRPERSEVVPLWYGGVERQDSKQATLSPTSSVLSLKGETKEKGCVGTSPKGEDKREKCVAVFLLERCKGRLPVPLGRRDKKGKALLYSIYA